MEAPRRITQVERAFDKAPEDVRAFLPDLPRLMQDRELRHGLAAALSYAFHRLEVAHRRALYLGLVRIHGVSPELARSATGNEHLSREHFQRLFHEVLRTPLPADARRQLDVATGVRDDLLHGRDVSAASLRKALLALVGYAVELHAFCTGGEVAMSPFRDDLRGFAPPGDRRLTNATSRFVLRGMGFDSFA